MLWRLVSVFFVVCLNCASHAAEITSFPLNKPGQGGIIITGALGPNDADEFLVKIAPYSGGIVILDSPGGVAKVGIDIGRAIRMSEFVTWVPSGSTCASACAMIWLGGRPRLMGKTGHIGFHSVYKYENGIPVETGSGNAVYGAYLAQLGLTERTIRYLSSADPKSMNWLTPDLAEVLEISMRVFDPQPNAALKSGPPITHQDIDGKLRRGTPADGKPVTPETSKSTSSSLEARARDFVIAINVLVSGPTEKFISLLSGLYADEVQYFGKKLPRNQVVLQIENFINRWPIRSYSARPESIKIQCDDIYQKCLIDGLIDFDAKSPARNQRSHGVAAFDYLLEFHPGSRWPVIVNEGGSVINRQMDVLNKKTEQPHRDFSIQ